MGAGQTKTIDPATLRLVRNDEDLKIDVAVGVGFNESLWSEATVPYAVVEDLRRHWRLSDLAAQKDDALAAKLKEFGCAFAEAILPPPIAVSIQRLIERARERTAFLPLRFEIQDDLAYELPWELLCLGEVGYLALHPLIWLSRLRRTDYRAIDPPESARALLVHANPNSPGFPHLLEIEEEFLEILRVLRAPHHPISVHGLRNAAPINVEIGLSEQRPHVFHFIGHGALPPTGGALILQGEQRGKEAVVYGSTIGKHLAEGGVLAAILSACETAGKADAVGETLVRCGVPAAIAMQSPIRDVSMSAFSREVHMRLSSGAEIENAVAAARKNLVHSGGWWVPVLITGGQSFSLVARPGKEDDEDASGAGEGFVFVGRRRERSEIGRLIVDEGCRLVTIRSIEGMGKTQTARQVARDLRRHFPDGTHFIDGKENATGEQLLVTILARLQSESGLPTVAAVREQIAHRKVLFVLDGLDALEPTGALDVVQELTSSGSGFYVLATSARRLDLAGQVTYLLPPMSLSEDPDDGCDSVDFFVKTVRQVKQDFNFDEARRTMAWEICRDLEGIPLAISMAAAWLRDVDLPTLRDLVKAQRQRQTQSSPLATTIEKAIAQLGEGDRYRFWRLSVFPGSFSAADAVEVLGGDLLEMLHLIQRLRDNCLLERVNVSGEVRYRILGPVRTVTDAFIQTETMTRQRREDRYRHTLYYTQEAEAISRDLDAGEWRGMSLKLWANIANIRFAVDHAVEHCLHESVAVFVRTLARPYFETGLWQEFDTLARVGHQASEALDRPDIAILLFGLEGALIARRGDKKGCLQPWWNRCELCERTGDLAGQADSLLDIGCHLLSQNVREGLPGIFERALTLATEAARPDLVATVQVMEARMALDDGDLANALLWSRRAETTAIESGHLDSLMFVDTNLGNTLFRCGEYAAAEPAFRKSLRSAFDGNRRFHVVEAMLGLGRVYRAQGRNELAVRSLIGAEKLSRLLKAKWLAEVVELLDDLRMDLKGTASALIFDELAASGWREIAEDVLMQGDPRAEK